MAITAGQAAALAEAYAKQLDVQSEDQIRQLPSLVKPYIEAHVGAALGLEGSIPTWVVDRVTSLPQETQLAITFAGQDSATVALWRQHKTVYHLDSDLWEELSSMSEDTVVPEGIFQYLPHSDPFVAFPEPLLLPCGEGDYMKLGGFYITGRKLIDGRGAFQRSTAHPDSTAFGLLFAGPMYRADGKPVMLRDGSQDYLFTRASVTEGICVKDIVENVAGNFALMTEINAWRQQLPVMLTAAVAALVYVCTVNADMTPLPLPPQKRKKGQPKPPQRVRVVGVGYRLGAALRAYKKQEARQSGQGSGRTVKPHVRRAHLHTFRVGQGRTQTRSKWLSRIEVNFKGQKADLPTVNKVRKTK